MARTRAVLTIVAVGLLLAACGEAGTADTAGETTDFDLMLNCGEARGALLELSSMTSRRARVDTSTVTSGAGHLRRLADRVSAAGEVRQDIDRMDLAAQAWLDGIRAIPPNIVEGRLIEPDTSALDETLIGELQPVRERLAGWVLKVCGTP